MNPSAGALLASLECWSVAAADPWVRLRELLEKHSRSDFGRAHHFGSIRSEEEFREAIPPMDYEDHRSWIERCAAGEQNVLACDEPFGFERTSGTSSEPKWIPLTNGLREEFARGLAAWFRGWQGRCPEVFAGSAYWAISPAGMIPDTSVGGLPVGAMSDVAYFPDDVGARLADWLVVPDLSGDVFEGTAEALLATPDLSVVSVWSPTFLLGIDAVVRKLRPGKTWRDLWPKLALVSCWADASSAPWIPVLRERLGGISIEPKGLLATEGITSLPDEIDGSPRLASECHWHEFLDENGDHVPVNELRIGQRYEVLLTTAGGLFRYRSGDQVEVTAAGVFPRLRFVGRMGNSSDLVGEKLHEQQVLDAFAELGVRGFLVAAPKVPGYELWLEDLKEEGRVMNLLRRNPYFDQALRLGQLAPVKTCRLPPDWSLTLASALVHSRGGRLGDVKLPALLTNIDPEVVASWLG
ncbi:GH3 auxin-responsive promoter family protein [Luteolibacter arcticus]|uniref:GH3 auxin-responsive promoter family protein n=1 Tax=Luteolibacter arcticus TaxID=1581411 RepID=A0ABT3GFC6_9BACT|nr:GH3 auxin-responsive promoter family protein [Luteolibacter arcticus]MCW1922305.1 GH3 auxin-responsive promoter family protein [Luteolibacter arcticus]